MPPWRPVPVSRNPVIAEDRVEGERLSRRVHGNLTEERGEAIVNAKSAFRRSG